MVEIHFRRQLFPMGERERKMNNRNLNSKNKKIKTKKKRCYPSWRIESKEFNSKDKRKMQHPNQEEWRKEGRQILSDKQQVKKNMFETRPLNEEGKLEQENREEGMQRKNKDKLHCSLYKFDLSLSFLSCVVRARQNLFNYEKNWKAMIRLVSLIVHVDIDYCYVRGRWIMREKKEEEKKREKRRDIQVCQFVITKPVMW